MDTLQLFTHIRILIGIVLGLGITHLLRHSAGLVEHPKRAKVWWVHLIWVLSTFLYLVHFWWWEFRLDTFSHWTFASYLFVILYTIVLYLLCALLFPEHIDGYRDFREYLLARRQWFFGALAAAYVLDFFDTWMKGAHYWHALGPEYIVRGIVFVALCSVAMRTRNLKFHSVFAVLGLLYQLSFILRLYYVE